MFIGVYVEIPNFYHGDYRRLAIIPVILLLISIYFIPHIKFGVDFKGGTLISLKTKGAIDIQALEKSLGEAGIEEATVKQFALPIGNEVEIEIEQEEKLVRSEALKTEFFAKVDDVSRLEADLSRFESNATPFTQDEKKTATDAYLTARSGLDKIADQLFGLAELDEKASQQPNTDNLRKLVSDAYRKVNDDYKDRIGEAITRVANYDSISVQAISATLSAKFIEKAVSVVVISAILTAIVVFFVFRTFIPSLAVMIGAAADATIALGAMGLFGIPFTLASFAALVMLIAFSLDTDILLTTRVIKRGEGHAADRAYDSMKTGITMSVTAFIAFSVLFVLSIMTNINTYYEISAVALAGLVGDVFATWGINAVIVLWYAEKVEKSKKEREARVLSTIYK